ncbi:MAG: peptidase S8, partial [candidate division KSB1 bacterium]|nr:peptidase S8 [candidate division KSB1 bacterium]
MLEAGTWQLPDGRLLQVGRSTTSRVVSPGGREALSTDSGSGLNGSGTTIRSIRSVNPLTALSPYNDSRWVKTRQHNVATNSFNVALEQAEVVTTSHGTETIGWLAITPGQGDWGGRLFQATRTSASVTHTWYS